MNNIAKGIFAGLIATAVLSALMIMKSMMGIMPQLDIIIMLSKMMGQPETPMLGWAAHFMIGAGYGVVFALIGRNLPGGSSTTKGAVLGAIGWLVMMAMIMPMAGAGLFGMAMGLMAPMMTLVLHLVFGAVLGSVHGRLLQTKAVAG
jgi:hypothetical protein